MVKELNITDKTVNLKMINPVVVDILEKVMIPRSRMALSLDFGIQAIHTSFAQFATMARLEYVPSSGNVKNRKLTTYYSMSFLKSGTGKDFLTDVVSKELFKDLNDGFDKLISKQAIEYNTRLKDDMLVWLEEEITPDGSIYNKNKFNEDAKTKFMPTTARDLGLRFGQATPEGLAYARSRVKGIDTGSPVLKIPEFSSSLSNATTKDLFLSLTELWECGDMEAKTTKGALLPSCEGIPIVFNAYTDPNKILNDIKKQRSLVDEFSSGMGRRTFIVYPEDEDFVKMDVETVREVPEDIAKRITQPIMENIKKFFNIMSLETWIKPFQRFEDDAMVYMEHVYDGCAELSKTMEGRYTHGEVANILALHSKIEKLASLYAFIDGRLEINVEDCKQATYWSAYTSKYLGKISRVLTAPERLYLMMSKRNDWVSGFEIEQAGIFQGSFDFNKSLDSTLQNLSQYCSMNNADLIVSQRDGGAIIRTRKIPLVNPDKLITSSMVGKHESIKMLNSGWNRSEFKFDELHKFMCGKQEGAMTACEFKDGIRDDDNATGRISFIALDFDDGISWDDGLQRFENYEFFAYQSRNHQKDKKGLVCDRFRIILLLERELVLSRVQYSSMYKNIMAVVAPEADSSCTNIGRIFFNSPDSEFVYNDGVPFKAHLFQEESKSEKIYSSQTKLDGSGLKDYFLSEIDIVNTTRTGGINLLVRAAYATKEAMNMSSKQEAKAWIKELSKQIFDDYWKHHNLEKEVMGILEKQWEK